MRSRRRPLLLLTFGLVVAACGNLGRSVPECDDPGGSLILSVQSVPGTAYAPCINALKTGWEYQHLEAQSGQSIFFLDSDRLGGGGPGPVVNPFLKVSLLPACDVSEAVEVESDETGVPLFVDVEVVIDVPITVVPDIRSLPTAEYAAQIRQELDGRVIAGRTVVVSVDSSNVGTSDRISTAQALGSTVVTISSRDTEDGTLTLILPGSNEELTGLKVDDVVKELEEVTDEASYVGSWYYPFENGCITYTFDAHGSGVDTIVADVQLALGLFDAAPLRQLARDLGYLQE